MRQSTHMLFYYIRTLHLHVAYLARQADLPSQTRAAKASLHHQTWKNGCAGRGRAALIESQTFRGPLGYLFGAPNVLSVPHLWRNIRFDKWHGVPSSGAGASLCSAARGAEYRRNSLAAPSGTDLPSTRSCAENCRFLNIHIFNQLKRLLQHTAAVPRTCTGNRGRHVTLAKQVQSEKMEECFLAGPMFVQIMTLFTICVELNVASISFFPVNTLFSFHTLGSLLSRAGSDHLSWSKHWPRQISPARSALRQQILLNDLACSMNHLSVWLKPGEECHLAPPLRLRLWKIDSETQ